MTLKERLSTIGQVFSKPKTIEIIKEVKVHEKTVLGGFIDFYQTGLSDETRISKKLIAANTGWVYRNTDVIAKEVSTIEFELFSVKTVGEEIVFNPIMQHPILDLLDRFNEFTTASDGFYTTTSHRILAGDSFWYLDGRGINVKAIYLLPPDKIKLKLGKIAGTQRVIEMYEYRDTIQGKPVEADYKPEQVLHFKIPNPKNPYRGLSKVEVAAEVIDTDNAASEANRQLFERGMINSFMLTTPNKITPEQLTQLRSDFESTYQGARNRFKVPIVGGDLKPETIANTNKDMEFIAQQEWLRDKLMSIWGNNKAVLGITDDVNRANADATILNWKRTTVMQEMKSIVDTLNEFLVPRWGDNLMLGFKDPVEENEDEKIAQVVQLKSNDIVTLNEAREMLSLDPAEGGDEFGFQRSERRQDMMIQNLPPAAKRVDYTKVLRRMGVYGQVEKYIKTREAVLPIARKLIKDRKAKGAKSEVSEHTSLTNEQVWAFHEKQIKLVEAHEAIFEDAVKSYIDELVDRALSQVPDEVASMQRKQLFNEESEVQRAVARFAPILDQVVALAGNEALKLINIDSPYIPGEVKETVRKNVDKFATSMIKTDRDKIIDMISQGIVEGQSIPKIRSNIENAYKEYSRVQANRVTRTEVIRASNLGSQDAWKQSGIVTEKQWLTARDDRVDPLCDYMNGKIIPVTKNFFDKGATLEVGDHKADFSYGSVKVPPLHPNCRCTLLPVIKGTPFGNDVSSTPVQTFYRGVGNNVVPVGAELELGEGFYVSRDKDIAGLYGSVSKVKIPVEDKDIYTFRSQKQWVKFREMIRRDFADIPYNKAVPQYFISQGYKAADLGKILEYAGMAIYDQSLIPAKFRLTKSEDSERVKELEAQVDKRTKQYRKLKEEKLELTDYIKELEDLVSGQAPDITVED